MAPEGELVRSVGFTGSGSTVTALVAAVQPVAVSVNVNVTLPAPTMLTVEPETVATAVLLLCHVPPLVGDNVIVPLAHTDDGPAETTGGAFTVMVAVAVAVVQPPTADSVYVTV